MARLAFWLVASLFLFVLSLELIRGGARPLAQWFAPNGVGLSPGAALGTGWLISCVVLSGSPVAAIALGLLDTGVLDAPGSFSMIIGSRLGASFVVLLVGLAYDLHARRRTGGVYVGALALTTTATIYVPAFFAGYFLLEKGWLEGVRFGAAVKIVSFLDLILDPISALASSLLPEWGMALLGLGCLIGAFKLFDGFLPVFDPTRGKVGQMATTIYRPWITFLFGMLVTCVTLSVSVSLTLLVPLTAKGAVRRENLIPYILGANITTFVDTLIASLLLKNQAGFTIVLCALLAVSLISVPVLLLAYRPFERLIDSLSQAASSSPARVTVFAALLLLVPLFLVWRR